jgi:aminoglycoside 6'-N-acetyltransferase I
VEYEFCKINESKETITQAAGILYDTFYNIGKLWLKNIKEATDEVYECIKDKNICIGIKVEKKLIGWVGLRPMYEKTWELHPMVIKKEFQKKGYGNILINELEKTAATNGIIGIVAGSDDETNSTSLSDKTITGENIFEEIKNIKNYKNHPYEFYEKCGYKIIGIIPNANGPQKPDIWLWKDIRKK